MALTADLVNATTSAAILASGEDRGSGYKVSGVVRNQSAGTVYLGGSDVTTSANHIALYAGEDYNFTLPPASDLYVIAGSTLQLQVLVV